MEPDAEADAADPPPADRPAPEVVPARPERSAAEVVRAVFAVAAGPADDAAAALAPVPAAVPRAPAPAAPPWDPSDDTGPDCAEVDGSPGGSAEVGGPPADTPLLPRFEIRDTATPLATRTTAADATASHACALVHVRSANGMNPRSPSPMPAGGT